MCKQIQHGIQKNISLVLSNKKILYIIGSLERGGAELHLLTILPELKKHNWKPSIYCLGHVGKLGIEFKKNDIEVIAPPLAADGEKHFFFYRIYRFACSSIKLFLIFKKNNYKIVHFFLPMSYVVGLPLSIIARNKITIMSRRSLNHYQKKKIGIKIIEKTWHKFVKIGLANSIAVAKNLRDEKMEPGKIKVLYNGVKTYSNNACEREICSEYNLKQGSFKYIIVANLIPYKGHADLLKAFSLIKNKLGGNWELLVVGEDRGILSDLKQLCNQYGINKNIKWLGGVREVHKLLKISDVGVSSSLEEGFSNSILEIMSAGLPVVATDAGGNSEAVVDGETGYLVPINKPSEMSKCLLKLFQNSTLRIKMGKAGNKRIEENFTVEKCVKKYNDLYSSLVENKPLPSLDVSDEVY